VEDFETTFRKLVLSAPSPRAAELIDLYHTVLVERVLPAHGNDPTWAGRVPAALLEAGLTDVDTAIHARSWPGGTAGALLSGANIARAREDFLAAGVTEAQLDEMTRLVNDPRLVVRGHFTYSTISRRPRRETDPVGGTAGPGGRLRPGRMVAGDRRLRHPAAPAPVAARRPSTPSALYLVVLLERLLLQCAREATG